MMPNSGCDGCMDSMTSAVSSIPYGPTVPALTCTGQGPKVQVQVQVHVLSVLSSSNKEGRLDKHPSASPICQRD